MAFPKVVLDGIDISHLLLSATPETEEAHDCIMFYKHPESQLGAAGAAQLDSLSAVRCGDYKAYWFIDGESTTPLPEGIVLVRRRRFSCLGSVSSFVCVASWLSVV